MNTKQIAYITLFLMIGLIALQVFVPKKIGDDGKIRVIGRSSSEDSDEMDEAEDED